MIIFDEKILNESASTVYEPIFGHTPDLAGMLSILAESQEQWNDIRNSLFESEIEEYSATLSENVSAIEIIQENAVTNFFEKAKKFFEELLKKLKGLWETFTTKMKTIFIRDGEKYQKEFGQKLKDKAKDLGKFEYVTHDWKIDKTNIIENQVRSVTMSAGFTIVGLSSAINKNYDSDTIKELKDKLAELPGKLRGAVVGENTVEASDFQEKFFDKVRGKDISKVGLGSSDIDEFLKVVTGKKDEMKTMQQLKSDIEKSLSETIKDLSVLEKKFAKTAVNTKIDTQHRGFDLSISTGGDAAEYQGRAKYMHMTIEASKKAKEVAMLSLGYSIKALQMKHSEARRILDRAIMYKPVTESATMAAILDFYDGNVEF